MQTFNHQDSASQTESELEDDEAQTLGLLKKVELPMQTFREYLKWQLTHKVKVEKIKTGFVVEEVPQGVEIEDKVHKVERKSGFVESFHQNADVEEFVDIPIERPIADLGLDDLLQSSATKPS